VPSPRSSFTVTLRPEVGVDGLRALRRLLKVALRSFGLRCVAVRERIDDEPVLDDPIKHRVAHRVDAHVGYISDR
jgi:hypothetical protein